MLGDAKISVIIPVYNTEAYLNRCLESVVNQTYNNLEIVCVNDCSTDNSVKILKSYAEKDSRIKIVSNIKNLGLYHARLEGFQRATGEYIAFLDSDDYISLDYYRCLICEAEEQNADVVISKIIHENSDGQRYIHNLYHFYDFDIGEKTPLEAYFEQRGQCFAWHTVWNKLYKKSIWDLALPYLNKQTQHLIMTEDFVFSSIIFSFVRKISYVDYSYHFYYQHQGASTSLNGNYKKYLKNIKDIIVAFNFVEEFLKNIKVSDAIMRDYFSWKELYSRFWYDNVMSCALNDVRKKYLLKLLKQGLDIKALKPTERRDHYFYSITTPWDARYYNLQNYLIQSEMDYYSFDIFDTLILRPFLVPSDLFYLLESDYQKLFSANNSFAEIRKSAEHLLRQKKSGIEVTLDEIYNCIHEIYMLDLDKLEILKHKEINLEIEKSYSRKSVVNLYKMLLFIRKKVVIISDIYLDLNTIESILVKNSITGYHKIFLSSIYGKTKCTGELYGIVAEELNVPSESIYHIGDSWESDFESARRAGLKAYFYARTSEVFKNSISDINNTEAFNSYFKPSNSWFNFEKSCRFFEVRCALALCANKLCDNPYETYKQNTNFNCNSQYIGYFPVGMHLLGVAQWINKNSKDYNRIHFIGRDGYLFKHAYDILYDENSNYLELSRKALLPLSIVNLYDVLSLGKYMSWDRCTPKKILYLLSGVLDIDNKKLKIDLEAPFESEKEFIEFLKFVIQNFYNEEKRNLLTGSLANHFKGLINKNDVLFDIGYSGRSQIILSRLLGYNLDGLYIHINDDENLLLQKNMGINIKSFYDFTPSVTGAEREYLFSKQVGSLVQFQIVNNEIQYVHEPCDLNYADRYCIGEIQRKAINFVADFKRIFKNEMEMMLCRNIDISIPFEQLIHNSFNDLDVFNACVFEDELYDGRSEIILSEIWRRDITYHYSKKTNNVSQLNNVVQLSSDDVVFRDFAKNKKWKKALCYYLADKATFKAKFKRWLRRGK